MATFERTEPSPELVRELGLLDSTTLVAGSMIGSGIFLVSAEIARQVGSAGWLLAVWLITAALTVTAALCYGELAAMMPHAGGQYVYLREAYSPPVGFLFGWTQFLVIQTGTIAAVAIGFARYLGVLVPGISAQWWIVEPIDLTERYAVSLSVQQATAIALILGLTLLNTRGLRLGKLVQNAFTWAKSLTLLALAAIGILIGRSASAIAANFSDAWTPRDVVTITPDLFPLPATSAATGALGLFVAVCVAHAGSIFAADAWNNVTFTAAEVKNPRRNVPLSLVYGTLLVMTLYLLANVAYLCVLPIERIQHALDDRVATATLEVVFGAPGAAIMAVAIIVSTFGCNNGLVLAGARVCYAMARDGLFFRSTGRLSARGVPARALALQGLWASLLVLPRIRMHDASGAIARDPATGAPLYGNLYNNLLEYVVFAVLVFYVLTIASLFVLRRTRRHDDRPYRAPGYPFLPALYILGASTIAVVLFLYRTETSLPGFLIVLSGLPVYALWRRSGSTA
ncbi:MAG TPA: amino acid permease [Thermoanaerobaculia bacterium]|nr:amino acid permease [Thermoanaerobaculia bacterium]